MKSKPRRVDLDALLDGRHEATERFRALARAQRTTRSIAFVNLGLSNCARNAQRYRQVEMADPQQVDAVDGGDGIGVLDALGGLDLADKGGALVGAAEFVGDGAGPVIVMGDLRAQRRATPAGGISCWR